MSGRNSLDSGVGFYTAIIAEVVGPGGCVVDIEVTSDLAVRARKNLSAYANVQMHSADGVEIDPGECDDMLIIHPHSLWLDQLGEGGRVLLHEVG